MIKQFLFILLFIGFISTAFSQGKISPSANLSLEFEKIRIGEQIKASLELSYDDPEHGKLVGWPKFDNELAKGIEIIDRTIDYEDPSDTTGGIMRKQDFQITSFEPGFHFIPSIAIELDDSTFYTTSTTLQVETVETDSSIVDIKPNYSVDYTFGEKVEDWFRSYWKWLAGIGIAIAAFFLFRLWKNRSPKEEEVPYVPPIPAHITALKSLRELEQEQAWQSSEQKEYYSDLTYTVRLYLEQRFGIKAVEQTTREIITELRYADISEEDKLHLRKLLSQADMIKFAKMKADANHGKDSLYKSIDFVEKTKKIEEEKGEEDA